MTDDQKKAGTTGQPMQIPDARDLENVLIYRLNSAFGSLLRWCASGKGAPRPLGPNDGQNVILTEKLAALIETFGEVFDNTIAQCNADKPAEGKDLVLYAQLPSVAVCNDEETHELHIHIRWLNAWVSEKTAGEDVTKKMAALMIG